MQIRGPEGGGLRFSTVVYMALDCPQMQFSEFGAANRFEMPPYGNKRYAAVFYCTSFERFPSRG
jgi:hypothetical protein